MNLYVTRHGETEYSLKGIVCGTTDCPLNESGHRQAESLAQEIISKGLQIDIIYTSPLSRALKTAEIISQMLEIPYIVDSRLREQDCGAYEGSAARDDKNFSEERFHFANRLRGGESALQLGQRVYNFLDGLCQNGENRTALIVGHACVCKIIHTYFHELTNEEYFEHKTGNCELVVYDI